MQRVLNNYDELAEILSGAGRIMFVHGKSAQRFTRLSECLASVSAGVYHFTSFTPNPKLEDAKAACESFRQNQCVFILTGGGALQLT